MRARWNPAGSVAGRRMTRPAAWSRTSTPCLTGRRPDTSVVVAVGDRQHRGATMEDIRGWPSAKPGGLRAASAVRARCSSSSAGVAAVRLNFVSWRRGATGGFSNARGVEAGEDGGKKGRVVGVPRRRVVVVCGPVGPYGPRTGQTSFASSLSQP